MSTLKTTYLQHPSSASTNLELKSDGTVTGTSIYTPPSTLIAVGRWNGETVTYSASWQKRSIFDTVNVDINRGGFTVESDGVTVPANGIYSVHYVIQFQSAVQRAAPATSMGVNDNEAAPYDYPLLSFTGYMRNVDGHNNSTNSASGIMELNSGDKLNMFILNDATSGSIDVISNGSWAVHRISE